MNRDHLPPFSCQVQGQVADILYQTGISLVLSTYQAGKVLLLSASEDGRLIQLPRTFNRAMGVAIDGDRMAIATKSEVVVLKNSRELAENYPKKRGVYDTMFLPMASYYTGYLDMHDLHFGEDGLYGVNTSFSCITKIDDQFSFRPIWQPPFIDSLISEDRCHLNGLAMVDNLPTYVSALGTGNTERSWRDSITNGGVIMHVPTSEVVVKGLGMPHAPRVYDGALYCLLSANQELVCVDTEKGTYDVVAHIPGFLRGMAKHGDYLFIGTSKIRTNSSSFGKLNIPQESSIAGLQILHLPSAQIVGTVSWLSSVDEIYDVQVLPQSRRPNILNTATGDHVKALLIPDKTYWSNLTES